MENNIVQQRVEEVFSFSNISDNIHILEGVFEPIDLKQIGCPPRGERVYHSAVSRLPLRANVISNSDGLYPAPEGSALR